MTTTSADSALISDNHTMTEPSSSPLRHILREPFSRQAWAELAYAIISLPLTVAALVFIIPMLVNGVLWGVSAPGVRKFGAATRGIARTLLGVNVPAPQPLRPYPYVRVSTPDAARLTALVQAEGARVKPRAGQLGILGLPAPRIAQLSTEDGIAVHALRPQRSSWLRGAIRDRAAWQARGYFALKRLVVTDRAVEKHISNIFTKLGLPPSDSDHRRVLAVLAYLGS
jgi:hypothetical protein